MKEDRSRQAPLNPRMPSPDRQPDSEYSARETRDKVEDALMSLTLDHRMAIVLRHFADLSYREIGWVLEIPEKTVKSRLYSARQSLSEILQHKGIHHHD